MSSFHFYYPIDIRYADLDPQWHVNNTKFLVYVEQARMAYFLKTGLWDGKDFNSLGTIVADVHVAYLAPIKLGQKIQVGVRVAHIGNKSLKFEYQIEDVETGTPLASAETINVGYNYSTQSSCRISDQWREIIAAFEQNPSLNATSQA